jgi:hypothetical protein
VTLYLWKEDSVVSFVVSGINLQQGRCCNSMFCYVQEDSLFVSFVLFVRRLLTSNCMRVHNVMDLTEFEPRSDGKMH